MKDQTDVRYERYESNEMRKMKAMSAKDFNSLYEAAKKKTKTEGNNDVVKCMLGMLEEKNKNTF